MNNKKLKKMIEGITGGVFCASFIGMPVRLYHDSPYGWRVFTLGVVSIKINKATATDTKKHQYVNTAYSFRMDKETKDRIDSTMKKFINGLFNRTSEQVEASIIAESTPCNNCGSLVLAGKCCNNPS